MKNQQISVVVATFKRDDFLTEALASLAKQTMPLYEVVVVDDGGPGSARAIVEGFGAGFLYLWQPNSGQQSARNHGVRGSTGDWIAFLDDDDLWVENRHELILELISTGRVDLISGDFTKFDRAGPAKDSVFEEFARHSPGYWDGIGRPLGGQRGSVVGRFPTIRLFPVYPFWPSTIVIQRALFEQLGSWDESLRGIKSEDIDFVFRAIKAGSLGLIGGSSLLYRCHQGNDSADSMQVAVGRVRIWQHLIKRSDLDAAERRVISDAICHGLAEVHWSAFASRDYALVAEAARQLGWGKLTLVERAKTLAASVLKKISSARFS